MLSSLFKSIGFLYCANIQYLIFFHYGNEDKSSQDAPQSRVVTLSSIKFGAQLRALGFECPQLNEPNVLYTPGISSQHPTDQHTVM